MTSEETRTSATITATGRYAYHPHSAIHWWEMHSQSIRSPQLLPTQALVIRAKVPACDHWNFQLNNFWLESLDYR